MTLVLPPTFRSEHLARGVELITPPSYPDERGAFSPTWIDIPRELYQRGTEWCQDSEVYSRDSATLRGLHYQDPPQAKLVRVLRGAIYDVAVDLTDFHLVTVNLSPGKWLYIPPGFAHGYWTLEPETLVTYKVDRPWNPKAEFGLRWNDPTLDIAWPGEFPRLSAKDQAWPLLKELVA